MPSITNGEELYHTMDIPPLPTSTNKSNGCAAVWDGAILNAVFK